MIRFIPVFFLLFGCAAHKPAPTFFTMNFDKEGHRGCRGLMPENTIPAMLKAIDLNATTLEMDVVISKDRKVIVSHEPWMNHEIATRPDGSEISAGEEMKFNIYQMTYNEVKGFDVGSKPHPRFPRQQKLKAAKPMLSDLVDSTEGYCREKQKTVRYNIEIKSTPQGDHIYHPEPREFTELLMQVLQEKGILQKVIIQSFDIRPLQYLHQQYPSVPIALLIEDYNTASLNDQLKMLGFLPAAYSPHYSLVTSSLIRDCHKKGIKVIPWTVNDKDKMRNLVKLGVDGLISDYPDLYEGLDASLID